MRIELYIHTYTHILGKTLYILYIYIYVYTYKHAFACASTVFNLLSHNCGRHVHSCMRVCVYPYVQKRLPPNFSILLDIKILHIKIPAAKLGPSTSEHFRFTYK